MQKLTSWVDVYVKSVFGNVDTDGCMFSHFKSPGLVRYGLADAALAAVRVNRKTDATP
ncbi:hypothetical protein D3C81_2120650 [compost metagenome]